LFRVMAKLSQTSQTAIAITFLVMNLSTHLFRLFSAFLCLFFTNTSFLETNMIEAYDSLICNQKKLMSSPSLNN
ncbi:transposase, partial [Nostoc sp. CHAB 5844]|nr:transposase [Nostoc sp. CHAB 5844]